MFRRLLLLLILAISLHGVSDSETLKRADTFMKSGSKSDYFRAYNDYKNLYLRSIMNDDSKLRLSSLKGIVKSGNKINIDISKYSKELATLKKKKSYKQPSKKDIKIKSSHKLKKVKWRDGRLVLEFDKKLTSKQVNYFTLYDSKKKVYKYIFDIHASMLTSSQNLRKKGISRIKLGQFNPTTLRLVIQNDKKVKVKFKKDSNELIINIITTYKEKYKKDKVKPKVAPATKVTTFKKASKDKVIVIDAGHGGKDPGAVGYKKYREKIVVGKIAKELKKILISRGYKVHMTRNGDKYIKLGKRTAYANKKDADIFVSIHANAVEEKNAHKAQGIESYFLSPSRSKKASRIAEKENSADMTDMNKYGKKSFLNFLNSHKIIASNKLAIDLQRGMLGSLNKSYKGVKDGGVREGPFWVLVGAQMPAVLVEVGFISHPKEAKRLVNSKYQKKLALGLANGIDRYFANN